MAHEKLHVTGKFVAEKFSQEDFDSFEGMCWECWDDQLTAEAV